MVWTKEKYQSLAKYGLYLLIFLLPWQTRWIFYQTELSGQFWEYGQLGLYATQLLLFIVVIFTLLSKPNWKLLKNWWPLNLLELWALLSALWAPQPKVALYQAGLIISASLLGECIIMLQLSVKKIAHILVVTGLVQGLLAISQFFAQHINASTIFGLARHSAYFGSSILQTSWGFIMRAYGSLPHPNILGGWLAVCWLAGLILRFQVNLQATTHKPASPELQLGELQPNFIYRIAIDFALLTILTGLLLTFSRSAAVSAAVGTIWLLIITAKKNSWSHAAVSAALIIIATIIITLPLHPLIAGRTLSLTKGGACPAEALCEGGLENFSLTDRWQTIQNGWQLFITHPLIGVGMGNSTAVIATNDKDIPVRYSQPPHLIPLAVMSELGVVGLLLAMVLLWLWRPQTLLDWYAPLWSVPLVTGLFDHYWFTLWAGLSLGIIILILNKLNLSYQHN